VATRPMTIRRPGLVLIHGAFHSGRCWAPTVAELERLAPGLPVVAVDLPGRGATPGDLRTLTIARCAESVVDQIEHAGLDEVVVVAHSLGGLTAPSVVARLGAARVARLVLISAVIPPEGASNLATIPRPVRWVMARALRPGRAVRPPGRFFAGLFFCNGMTPEQREVVYDQLCPEAPGPFHEPVSRTGLPASVPRTWLLTLRDRANRPRQQRASIANLGDVDEVIEIDTCHDAMVSEPATLAAILADRCVRRPAAPGIEEGVATHAASRARMPP
jgi:pimeloyl-ACP methyl ester carboxylesterase